MQSAWAAFWPIVGVGASLILATMFHVTPSLAFLTEELERLRERNQLRRPREQGSLTELATNDYLGLARRDGERTWGATGSRLISGDHAATRALEGELGRWLGLERVLVFTSGYAANVGALAALLGAEDVVFSDALNHASLIDGMRLSRATIRVFPHNDLAALEHMLESETGARRRWVVTESYFSMDADGPDLRALRSLCDAHSTLLYLDEAHALGVLGPRGRGLAAEAGIAPDAFAATLGKSLGAQGAFVGGVAPLYDYLWNKARSFVFSTGLSPALAQHAMGTLREVEAADDLRTELAHKVERFRASLVRGGLAPLGHGPIVPLVVGSEAAVLGVSERVQARGFHVQPIRPPTVPAGASRLRVTVTAFDSHQTLDALSDALVEAVRAQ